MGVVSPDNRPKTNWNDNFSTVFRHDEKDFSETHMLLLGRWNKEIKAKRPQ